MSRPELPEDLEVYIESLDEQGRVTYIVAPNIVSACFVTLNSPEEANVTQLFTHPLYRARGLATTEVATSMNKLLKRGVRTLMVWVTQNNDIAGRLFTKLGFKESHKLVEMAARIQQRQGAT